MDRELKFFKFEVKEVDEEEGTFTGHAATFSDKPDSWGDIIDPGAFTKTLKEGGKRIKSLWNHSVMEPIGKPIEMAEDDTGLAFKIKLSLGVQRAREVLSLIKDGVITEMSIGYDTMKETYIDGIRHLQEIRLWDLSPVTFAANPDAIITGVKQEADIREIAKELHELQQSKAGRVLSATSLEKVRKALEALQALLEAALSEEEPEKSTLLSEEVTEEAAALEMIVGTLKAENEGFDTQEAGERIEAILVKLRK